MSTHHPDRPARLHQHRLVRLERGEGTDHCVEGAPVPGRPAGAAVDHQVIRSFGNLGVQVVHQHPQRSLGGPALGCQRGAPRRPYASCAFHGDHHLSWGWDSQARGPTTDSAAATTAPLVINSTVISISGASQRSVPGPGTPAARREAITAPVEGDGESGARSSMPRAAVINSTASTRVSPSTASRSLRPADQPIDTWSSCMAELGMESTEAGTASRFISDTMAAAV